MGKVFIIDNTKCNGCYNCQLSCKDEHVMNDWSPIAKPQPNTGHFWYKITENVQGTVPKVRVRYTHDFCRHCDDAPCMKVCTEHAIYKREDGLVILDPEKCRGHRSCVSACPYGVIYFNRDLNISQKCTGCAHLIDDGWTEPRCVGSCPTDALIFGDDSDPAIQELIALSEPLPNDKDCGARVYNIRPDTKVFIAGEVYDPVLDECLEDAEVTLLNEKGKKTETLKTDVFGDFWFERKERGTYSLKIKHKGYAEKTIENIEVKDNLNVGEIALTAK